MCFKKSRRIITRILASILTARSRWKRACVALGISSKEHGDLVTTLFQTLPTVQELGEPSGVAEKDRSSDEEAMLITAVPGTSGHGTPLRENNDCALLEAMLRESSTRKRKRAASPDTERLRKL